MKRKVFFISTVHSMFLTRKTTKTIVTVHSSRLLHQLHAKQFPILDFGISDLVSPAENGSLRRTTRKKPINIPPKLDV